MIVTKCNSYSRNLWHIYNHARKQNSQERKLEDWG